MKSEIDEPSGQSTTGHEWDGIKELNTPVPKSLMWWLWLSIAVAAILWMLYPAWPSLSGYSQGALGYSSRANVQEAVAEGKAIRAAAFDDVLTGELAELAADPSLQARIAGPAGALYRDNCAACHGRDLKGQSSFPNLTDEHWLWSGDPEEIAITLRYGINASHEDSRYAEMPAFGRQQMLESDEIYQVVEYVLQISGSDHDAGKAKAGAAVFEENCSACHNDGGVGGYENGAPSLVDEAWIYGGTRKALRETLHKGRAGLMPHWQDRLTEAEIKMLALYVYWAGKRDEDE